MKMTIIKKIGKNEYPFEFEGNTLHEVVMESQKLSFPDVNDCGKCGSEDLYLSAHVAEGKYKYTEIRCNKCRAELTFGTRQDNPETVYLRKNDGNEYAWKEFSGNTENTEPVQDPKPEPKPQPKQNNAKNNNSKAADKPSGKAINYATKISTAKDMKALNEICNKVKNDGGFNEIDIIYLRNECVRKRQLLTGLPAL